MTKELCEARRGLKLKREDPRQNNLFSFFSPIKSVKVERTETEDRTEAVAEVRPQVAIKTEYASIVNARGRINIAFVDDPVQDQLVHYRDQVKQKHRLEYLLGLAARCIN